MNYLITIIGPTAIGKTALSIALAKEFHCDIISCDSRQFFKEMAIGTAAPTQQELSEANHHFIQNKSIAESYSVGDFEKEAIKKLEDLFLTNNYAVLVGGSGLYVDAILKGFDEFPEINVSVREEVIQNYEQFGISYLQQKIESLDFEYFQKIKTENPQTLQNPQRMMRFVEVCIGTGKPYSSFLNQKKNNRNFTPILIGLEAERGIIYERINQRVEAMMRSGLLPEVQGLYSYKNLNALQTVGYRELFGYINGEYPLDFAIEEIKKNTRRFAKRQLTWFKRNEKIRWFDFNNSFKEILDYISSHSK